MTSRQSAAYGFAGLAATAAVGAATYAAYVGSDMASLRPSAAAG